MTVGYLLLLGAAAVAGGMFLLLAVCCCFKQEGLNKRENEVEGIFNFQFLTIFGNF